MQTPIPPPVWMEVTTFFQQHANYKPTLTIGSLQGWRCRAKLAVRGTPHQPLIGLFKEGTHEVVPIPHCQAHHPAINQAVKMIIDWMLQHKIVPYQEQTGEGDLRYLQLVVERATQKVQASFVLNIANDDAPRYQKWLSLLQNLRDPLWHSLWMNLNTKKTNTIFGEEWILCQGEDLLWETFGHIQLCYHPASFAQANLNLFEALLERIKQQIHPGVQIAEFYAGVGVIGLYLAKNAEWVRCAEINRAAEDCFLQSRQRLKEKNDISYFTGNASQLLSILDQATTIIVDPPRKGLDTLLLKRLTDKNLTAQELFYISCGWPSFQKDYLYLTQHGWQLENVEGFLFFPGTNHIELLVHLIKN